MLQCRVWILHVVFFQFAEKQAVFQWWDYKVLFLTGSGQKWGAQNCACRRSGLFQRGERGTSFLFSSAFTITNSAKHTNHTKFASYRNIMLLHLLSVVQMENSVTMLSLFLTISFRVILWGNSEKYISLPSTKSYCRHLKKTPQLLRSFFKMPHHKERPCIWMHANPSHNMHSLCRLSKFWKQNALDMDTTHLKIQCFTNNCSNRTCILR